ncbi:hypothetical protein HGRIS_002599 [Hohenbuehelia grisea]|uniref:BSD domain-containing protein n=1 Tax=Hohenbuehelia grisea TaxID=104357 RepID=A0ABR3JLM7_9AGAR
MNFLDPYDLTNSTNTPPPEPSTTPGQTQTQEQTLNEEVSQVIGQLGRFWGGFRKQSQAALSTARKDFGDVVLQAQKELTKLAENNPLAGTAEPAASTPEASSSTSTKDANDEPESDDKTPVGTPPSDASPSSSAGATGFLSRIQSTLPPNIVATLQNNIPESLKHASENVDFAQLRTTLSSEFQRVQGVTRTQAEEYVRKSENLLREAMKDAQEVLKDAVKIIPPEEGSVSASSSSGLVWDGSDMWMLPYEPSDGNISKGKARDTGSSSGRASGEAQRVATRAEALLKRLKHDAAIIRHEPDSGVFDEWTKAEIDTKEGGIEASEWKSKVDAALNDTSDGAALRATQDELVPAEMDKETFWKRYFFRVHQIHREEEKRKALLQAPVENDDDFSWEDEEEEASPVSEKKELQSDATPTTETKISTPQVLSTAGSSPRESSEDSYDLVSSTNASAAGDKKSDDSDGDSDWE